MPKYRRLTVPKAWNGLAAIPLWGWQPLILIYINGDEEAYSRQDFILVLVAEDDVERSYPARILDMVEKNHQRKVIVAYYMELNKLRKNVHKDDAAKYHLTKVEWLSKGKRYSLTNEVAVISPDSINGRDGHLEQQIWHEYVLCHKGTKYQRRSSFIPWAKVLTNEDTWWKAVRGLVALTCPT